MSNRVHCSPWRSLALALPLAGLIALLWAAGASAGPGARPSAALTNTSWATGGPYGGEVIDLAVNPVTPTTAYATLHNAGLYMTEDGGDTWRPAMIDSWPQGVALDAVDPRLVFFAGQHHLYRSPDGGATWEQLNAPTRGDARLYPVTHPISSGVLYLAVGAPINRPPQEGEAGGVYRWIDAERRWITATVGLTDTLVTAIAFAPADAQTLVAGTRNGHVFASEDGGETWEWRAKVDDYVYRLAYNPLVAGEVWALTKDPVGTAEPPAIYRSTDATLQAWEPLILPDLGHPVSARSVAFDTDGGTAYLALHGEDALVSTNGGVDWEAMAGSPPSPTCFGMTADGLRTIGTIQRGTYVSADGDAWEQATQGLAGVLPEAMVVIPGQPEDTFAYAPTLGMLRTADGGQSWDEIDGVRRNGYPWRDSMLAAEGGAEPRVYLGSGCDGAPCLKVGDLSSGDWPDRALPMPPSLGSDWTADVFAVYADPSQPGHVLAGVTFYPPDYDMTQPTRPLGAIYASDDRGGTWEVAHGAEATPVISGVVEFASSPTAPEVIYAATDGTGLLKSADGGDTWEPVAGWSGPLSIRSVAVGRVDPDTVYVAATDQEGQALSGVFVSNDGGATWEHMPGTGGDAWVLHMAATDPPVLFLGTWGGGVKRLGSGGVWSPVVEVPERSNVFAIASGRDEDRAIVYIGLTGDSGANAAMSAGRGAVLRAAEARSGGIYQLVVPNASAVYLPLSVSRFAP